MPSVAGADSFALHPPPWYKLAFIGLATDATHLQRIIHSSNAGVWQRRRFDPICFSSSAAT
jgi:hypothetical protein